MKSQKNRERKVQLFIFIVLLVIVLIAIRYIYLPENTMSQRITYLTELLSKKSSRASYVEYIGINEFSNTSIITGKDSFIREKPNSEEIETHRLEEYVKIQDELATNVEKKIISNLEYKVGDIADIEEDVLIYHVKLKTYYEIEYQLDLIELRDKLLEEYRNKNENINEEIAEYKAKVLAMKLLNDKLKNYENSNEYCVANIYYYKDSYKTSKSLVSYLNALQGSNYNNDVIDTLTLTREDRINDYIKDAKTYGVINSNNILELV